MKKTVTKYAAVLLCFIVNASAALCDTIPEQQVSVLPLRQMHSQNILGHLRVIALLSKSRIITAESDLAGHSAIDVWSMHSKTWIKTTLLSPTPTEQDSVCLSPDAHLLLARESTRISKNAYYSPHRLFVWNLDSSKLVKTVDLGQNFDLYGVAFLPEKPEQIILTAREGEINKILYVAPTTGTILLKRNYPDGTFLTHDEIFFHPTRSKWFVCSRRAKSRQIELIFLTLGTVI